MKNKLRKTNSGITLIALVITIIIIIILSTVAISFAFGDNGILTRANDAKTKTEDAEKDEKEKLGDMEDVINEYTTGIEVEQVTDENPGVLEIDENNATTYIINSIEDLVFFANNVTGGNTYEGKTVKLGLSLDFKSNKSYVDPFRTDYAKYGYDGELKTLLTSDEGFIPIGTIYKDADKENYSFAGIFEGNNNTISNLYINKIEDKESRIGMFAHNYGNVQNINLNNLNIQVESISPFIGGITGYNFGKIKNVKTSGNIVVKATDGTVRIGGTIGISNNIVQNCKNNSNIFVTIEGTGTIQVGGVCGVITGKILDCYNQGNVTVNSIRTNTAYIGGICGQGNGETKITTIENSKNSGEIWAETTKSGVIIGGILGSGMTVNISDCYNIGMIKGANENLRTTAGGICGSYNFNKGNEPEFANCYSIGNLDIFSNEENNIGELVGYLDSNIMNSYYLNKGIYQAIGRLGGSFINETIEIEDLKSENFINNLNDEREEKVWKKGKEYPILYWE